MFRLVAAAVLLPIGVWLTVRAIRPCRAAARPTLPPARVSVLGGVVGVAGGSLLAPIVVATGLSVAAVAQAALSATLVTSVVGALTFAALALVTPGAVTPEWVLGLVCGLGGLAGGYVGARLSRQLPERALTLLLGVTAIGMAVLYVAHTWPRRPATTPTPPEVSECPGRRPA